jgi:hypothetical protein
LSTTVTCAAIAIAGALLGCSRDDASVKPPTPPPVAVDIPGRPADPLVVYAAGSEPAPGPAPARGMFAVAFDSNDVYFLDSRVQRLLRQPRAGGLLQEVAARIGEADQLELSPTHAYISRARQPITELAKSGGNRREVVSGNEDRVNDFAVDATRCYLATARYYGNGPDPESPSGKILAVSLADLRTEVLASGIPGPASIAADDDHVYYVTVRQIGRVAKAGGAPQMVADLGDNNGWRIRVAGGHVYFTVLTMTSVYLARAPAAGGAIERLAYLKTHPTSFAVAGEDIYIVAESDRKDVMTLWRLNISTRKLDAIATDLVGYPFVAADERHVAWTSGADGFVLTVGERTPRRVRAQ